MRKNTHIYSKEEESFDVLWGMCCQRRVVERLHYHYPSDKSTASPKGLLDLAVEHYRHLRLIFLEVWWYCNTSTTKFKIQFKSIFFPLLGSKCNLIYISAILIILVIMLEWVISIADTGISRTGVWFCFNDCKTRYISGDKESKF